MMPDLSYYQFQNTQKNLNVAMVVGGQQSNKGIMGSSTDMKVVNSSFREALIATLEESDLFATVNLVADPDYELSSKIVRNKISGLMNKTAELEVNYILFQTEENKTIWEKNITSTYVAAGLKEGFTGWSRASRANEGSIRENIRQMVEEISKLEL